MRPKHVALILILTLALAGPATLTQAVGPQTGPDGINWQAAFPYASATLTISGPEGMLVQQEFPAGVPLYFSMRDAQGTIFPDGQYTYELLFSPILSSETQAALRAAADGPDREHVVAALREAGQLPEKMPSVSGHFRISGGAIVTDSGAEEAPEGGAKDKEGKASPSGAELSDVLHYDDVIITGSLCVGFDCQNGESFGFDTVILKEHNLRIYFNDTSYTANYPTHNWRITINDSTNGGASYFAIDDVDEGTTPFRIEAGTPSNTLYVEDYGRVGLGTSTPVVELHIKDPDTPTVRLEQDSSGGWTPQAWDLAGNETNFFVRDVTNGSKLSFRIQPSTPSSTLCLKSSGYVGIGTWSPAYPLEVETTGEGAAIVVQRTDGATGEILGAPNCVYVGSISSHPLRLMVAGATVAEFDIAGNLEIKGTLTENGLTMQGQPEMPLDNDGAAPAELRELVRRIEAQDARIRELEQENQALAQRLAALEALVLAPQKATR